jgi:hypothetical protein
MITLSNCVSGVHVVVHEPDREYEAPITRSSNITSGSVTRAEIGNLLENFKTDILGTLTTQLDVLQVKQKQAEAEQSLAIFFHDAEGNMVQGSVPWMWFGFVPSVPKTMRQSNVHHSQD